jgi:serine/threonine protein kinase
MRLSPGTRVGAYEIVAALGAGGMGEVYRARDGRLNRTVAIKVLTSSLDQNVSFRERFQREAQTIATLQHPNICVLHDVGDSNGVPFLVMEFLEGQTLQARLEDGPLPLIDVLRLATQIASALAYAHGARIIHRDLKPGNIMLTATGGKLLDF